MKRNLLKTFAFIIILLFIFGVFNSSMAENLDETDDLNTGVMLINEIDELAEDTILEETTEEIPPDGDINTINKNLFKYSNEDITLTANIDGDAFIVCAGKVTIDSEIYGNLFICANSIELSEKAYVSSSLFTISSDFTNNGTINSNQYSVNRNCTLTNSCAINKDLFLLTQYANINSTIYNDCNISCNKLNVSDEALIFGNLNYSSSNEIEIPEEVVDGNINYTLNNEIESANINDILNSKISEILHFVVLVIAIILSIKYLFTSAIKDLSYYKTNIKKIIIFGLLSIVIYPIIFAILLLMQVTISIALISFIIYLTTLFISSAYLCSKLAFILYEKIKDKISLKNPLLIQISLGTLLAISYKILQTIPTFGFMLTFIFIVLGFGDMIFNILPQKNNTNSN